MDTELQRYIQAMPQYGDRLRNLQRILDFQAELANKVKTELDIRPTVAQKKWCAGKFLLQDEALSVPPFLLQEALAGLRPLLSSDEAMQLALDRLLVSNLMASPNIGALLNDLVTDAETCLTHIADVTSSNPVTMAFLPQTVLSPFFEKQAMPYRAYFETSAWRQGICPMCGSEPGMARLTYDNGQRILACALCRTEWPFDRLRCPFCEGDGHRFDTSGRNQPHLRSLTVEDDKMHRVDCCDRCQRYLKTVDERVSGCLANLTVENIVTTHLDALAGEYGYW
jgi:formate dehydrogenase maturation protein FdhE